MPDETDEQLLDRYRQRHPHISLAQAVALNRLSTRYAPLLAANQEKARLRREAELAKVRRQIFGTD